ncbi:MAG: PQQ-binding-like beta-propeller repeat protein [Planctomycetota bacterium]
MRNCPSVSFFRLSDVCRVMLFAVLVLLVAPATRAADPYWPRFHGPAGNNMSRATGLLEEWPEDGPELVWTAEGLGVGFASVSLVHGNIYTAGNIDGRTVVMALDLDGQKVWQTDCGEAWTKSHEGTRSTPTIDGDRLYYETPLGDLVCLNAHTGQRIWGLNILDKFAGENIRWALAESPVVDGDLLICCPFGDLGSVVALNKKTGETVWAADPVEDRAGYATPAIAEFAGRRMVLTMSSKALVGVDISNGDLLFRYEHITKYDVNALTPICVDGHVFISSGYGSGSELVKLTATGGKITAEQVWENKDLDNHHGGVILLDGHIYGADSRRYWLCLDWETGETEYQEQGVGKGSLTFADGMLYTLSEKGRRVGLVKPTPDEHKLVSEFRIPEGGEGPTWAHPVVCAGRLYVRHGDLLFAFDVKK